MLVSVASVCVDPLELEGHKVVNPLPIWYWEQNSGPLQTQSLLLNAESPLQLGCVHFSNHPVQSSAVAISFIGQFKLKLVQIK